jgi:hypothetical protein
MRHANQLRAHELAQHAGGGAAVGIFRGENLPNRPAQRRERRQPGIELGIGSRLKLLRRVLLEALGQSLLDLARPRAEADAAQEMGRGSGPDAAGNAELEARQGNPPLSPWTARDAEG